MSSSYIRVPAACMLGVSLVHGHVGAFNAWDKGALKEPANAMTFQVVVSQKKGRGTPIH